MGLALGNLDRVHDGAVRLVYRDEAETDGSIEPVGHDFETVGRLAIAAVRKAIPCFTPGTRVATPYGERPVEALVPGDMVLTRDNGAQPVVALGQVRFDWRALGTMPMLRPVRIRKGALGDGLPMRDIVLSPNHRLVVTDRSQGGSSEEGLAEVQALLGRPGIEVGQVSEVTYLQLLLPRHEAVLSDGLWTESFQKLADDMDVRGICAQAETDLLGAHNAGMAGGMQPVRPDLGVIRNQSLGAVA